MCYSALVQQDLRTLARRFGAAVDWESFEGLFRARLEGEPIKVARALEANFTSAESEAQQRTAAHIAAFQAQCEKEWQTELFKQRKRLADAQRSLEGPLTEKQAEKARNTVRIATNKSDGLVQRLNDLHRTEARGNDTRIFPMYYAPLVVAVEDRRVIKPMRYTCRLAGKPAAYDKKYPSTYNARRDNLDGFWSSAYGRNHGILVVTSFFENVPSNLYEKRVLAPVEKPKNLVLQFNPQPPSEMLIACLWSHWTGKDAADLDSFAAVTDEPPQEIAATGHTRCIIALEDENIDEWLAPSNVPRDRLEAILSDRQVPFYEHRIAA